MAYPCVSPSATRPSTAHSFNESTSNEPMTSRLRDDQRRNPGEPWALDQFRAIETRAIRTQLTLPPKATALGSPPSDRPYEWWRASVSLPTRFETGRLLEPPSALTV